MPIDEPEECKCISGPKIKTLATEHLEYIAHAMLNDRDLQPSFTNDEWVVTIQEITFSLTKILQAEPQFEFIRLSNAHLDAYLLEYDDKKPKPCTTTTNDSIDAYAYLHDAEKIALSIYASSGFSDMNRLLREPSKRPDKGCWPPRSMRPAILCICVAAHALYKRSPDDQRFPQRSQYPIGDFYRADMDYVRKSGGLITVNGFFSTSQNPEHFTKCPTFAGAKMRTVVKPSQKCQPSCLDISSFGQYSHEKEVLFPPNTPFLFKQVDGTTNWEAEPVYNPDSSKPYYHSFKESTLHEIRLHHHELGSGSSFPTCTEAKPQLIMKQEIPRARTAESTPTVSAPLLLKILSLPVTKVVGAIVLLAGIAGIVVGSCGLAGVAIGIPVLLAKVLLGVGAGITAVSAVGFFAGSKMKSDEGMTLQPGF